MNLSRRDLVVIALGLVLLAIAVVRLAVPDRSRLRPLSVEAIDIATEEIAAHATLERLAVWTPPEDVYVVGWGPRVHARGSKASLMLFLQDRKIMLFDYTEDGQSARNEYVAPGTGFRVAKGEAVTLRYRINNGGPAGPTHGAMALIYFVPVEGN
jgi:hypothetical protein